MDPGLTPGGIFYNDTRYLSGVQLLIDGQRPLLLSAAVENDNVVLTVDLSNPDIYQNGNVIVLPREILHIRRSKFLWQGTCHERIAIHNFDTRAAEMLADHQFRRRFRRSVRDSGHAAGQARRHHLCGRSAAPRPSSAIVGLDRIERRSEICFDPPPPAIVQEPGDFMRWS